MIERLNMQSSYSDDEACIHLARYCIAKDLVLGKRVLDVACGEGYGSYLIRQWGAESVVGVDIDGETVEKAKQMFVSDGLEYYEGSAEDLSFLESRSFDIVISFETMEHVSDPLKYLHEIKRLVKEDGGVIISCPNDHYYYPDENSCNPFHKRKYTFEEFDEVTCNVLGNTTSRFISGIVFGFINCYMDNRAKAVKNQSDMLQSLEDMNIKSFRLPADIPLEINNSCYWLFFWDYSAEKRSISENAVSYTTDYLSMGKSCLRDTIKRITHENTQKEKEIERLNVRLDSTIEYDKNLINGLYNKTEHMEVMIRDLEDKLRLAIAGHGAETDRLNRKYEAEVERLNTTHKEEVERLSITHKEETEVLIAKYEAEKKALIEKIKDKELLYLAAFNELEFLKKYPVIKRAEAVKPQPKKEKAMLHVRLYNRFMAMKNEKLKNFLYGIYSKLPYGIRKLIHRM